MYAKIDLHNVSFYLCLYWKNKELIDELLFNRFLPPASNSKSADMWKYDIEQNAVNSFAQYEVSS